MSGFSNLRATGKVGAGSGFMLRPRLLVGMAFVLATAATARAQEQNPAVSGAEAPRFETAVVVTPERGSTPQSLVPAVTVVLERQALSALPAAHPSELISFLPGFTVARPRFDAGRPIVSARGFFGGGEADYVLLLVDGVPVADAESGLVDWGAVPTSSIQRIEAFRGPGASLYGDSAVGGVVQILTDRSAQGGRLTTTGGSFGTFDADGSWGWRTPLVASTLSGAARRTGGAYQHSSARQYVGAGGIDGRLGDLSWRWTADGGWRRRDDPGSLGRDVFRRDPYSSDPLYRFDGAERRDGSTAITLRHQSPLWLPQARIALALRDEDLVRTILLAPGVADRRARALSTVAVRGSLEGERVLGATRMVTLRFGTDASRERLDTAYRSVSMSGLVQDVNSHVAGHRIRTGLFASSAWEATSRVRLSAGLRWDNVDDGSFRVPTFGVKRAWAPRAGVSLQLNDARTLSLFAQASRAFKVPTLEQLFDPRPYPDFRGGTFTISNPQLVPQRATSIEAGLSGSGPARWSLVAYRARVDDEIDFDVRTFSYANIGESRHTGLELQGETTWGRFSPSISYVLSRVTEAGSDRQLKNVPRHRLSFAAGVELPWTLHAYARFEHSAGAFLDDENAVRTSTPSTMDLRVRRPFGRHALFVDVFNVTADQYEEYGFTLRDFASRLVPYMYPGAPRAVRAGLTLAF
jgi:outer membrane cobalamin receptor